MHPHPQTATRFSRRTLIVGGAAAAVGVASASVLTARLVEDEPRTLRWKGVNVDTDRSTWRPEFIGNELRTIARDLHANAVLLGGSDQQRLVDGATMAADEGLAVWLEPRQFESGSAETLAFVEKVARAAARLRDDGANIGLSLGVELTLFLDGLVPGDDWLERGRRLSTADPEDYNRRLNRFLADAADAIRPVFAGQLTYSSGPWEAVDWEPFDIVGVDLYRDAANRTTYTHELRRYLRHGKPVFITEFGCCTFDGAADYGGDGFMQTMDGDLSGLVRDEQEQATEIGELLDIYEAEGVHGAFIWNFIEPDNTYSPDPLHDLDMTGFSLVKCFGADTDPDKAYERTGYYEPKRSFHAAALRYASDTGT